MTFQTNINLHMLKKFLMSTEVLIFSPRKFHHCFWRSKHNLIYHHQHIPWLTPDVTFFSTLNIPFKSEQKQKFQIKKAPPGVSHAKRKYSLTLHNFSLSSQQLILNYIHFLLGPLDGLFFKPKYQANILYLVLISLQHGDQSTVFCIVSPFFILANVLTSISEGFWPNFDKINISPRPVAIFFV